MICAVLLRPPVALVTVTVIWNCTSPPVVTLAGPQVTTPPLWLQPALAETKVTLPAGSVSATVTPVAWAGPALATVSV